MLIAMSFHVGLLLVTVTTLAVGQFFIELHNQPRTRSERNRHSGSSSAMEEPLLDEISYPLTTTVPTRPRSKSRPEDILIHPNHSNLARADAVALELGLSGNTDRVHGNVYPHEDAAWEYGKGRDVARALLGGSNTRRDSQRHAEFGVGPDSDSEDSSISGGS